jgi:hypothetical protein
MCLKGKKVSTEVKEESSQPDLYERTRQQSFKVTQSKYSEKLEHNVEESI